MSESRESESRSFESPLFLVQLIKHPANLGPLLGSRRLSAECAHDQPFGRPAKNSLQKISSDSLLHIILWRRGLINVGPKTFTTDQQSFVGHQPHLRQGGVVIAVLLEGLMYLSNSGRPKAPKDSQYVGFSGRGHRKISIRKIGMRRHEAKLQL